MAVNLCRLMGVYKVSPVLCTGTPCLDLEVKKSNQVFLFFGFEYQALV